MSDSKGLARFALIMLDAWHNNGQCGDVDGAFIEEKALDCGLITFDSNEDGDYTIAPKVFAKIQKLRRQTA